MDGPHLHSLAIKGARVSRGKHGRMCNDCACKLNSPANQDEAALQALEQQLTYGLQFNCHTPDFQDANRRCAGFLYIKELFAEIDRIDEEDLKDS